jgi:hypothetical protein
MSHDQLAPPEVKALRALLDRSAVETCVHQYFHALDSRAFDLLNEVFAPDVDVADGVPSIDRGGLIDLLRGVGQFPVSHHGVRNMRVELDGDRAHANTFAMDFLLLEPAEKRRAPTSRWPVHDDVPDASIRLHGLRYVDDLARLPEGWRITKRRGPIALWRCEVAGARVHPQFEQLRSAYWPGEEAFRAAVGERSGR